MSMIREKVDAANGVRKRMTARTRYAPRRR
jgi:hypothetical protein